MKALKNVKMGWKLFALALPLVIAIVVSVIVTGLKIKNTEAEVTSVYYDMLYQVNNNLVSADRDLYRTLNGATYYYNYNGTAGMFEGMVNTNLREYKDGKEGLVNNVAAAAEIASTNETLYRGITCEEGETFEEDHREPPELVQVPERHRGDCAATVAFHQQLTAVEVCHAASRRYRLRQQYSL